ncbi:MAG: ABC transporter permease subunit [bacterium]|nr:ABC transporter permease subunit [bacterium]MCP4967332.1 ABC transporter permease subunit [bacterium]
MKSFARRGLSAIVLGLASAFFLVPLLVVVWSGLAADEFVRFPPGRPELSSVVTFFEDDEWRMSFWVSIRIAIVSAVLALIVGTACAVVVSWASRAVALVLIFFIIAPAVIPIVVQAVGLVGLGRTVAIDGIVLVTLGHVVISVPFVFLVMRVAVGHVDVVQIQAAQVLGAGRWLTASRVVAPSLAPFMLVALAIAASISLAEPILAIFILDDGSATLPQRSFQGLRFSFDPILFTAAAVLVIITAVLLTVSLGIALVYRRMAGSPTPVQSHGSAR